MITWLPALLRIVGRIINGIMNVNAIKECRLLCDFQMRKVCYSEINPWLTKVRNTGNLFKGCRYFVHGYVCCVVGHIEASQIDNQENYHDGFYDKGTGKLEIRKDAGSLIFIFLQIAAQFAGKI